MEKYKVKVNNKEYVVEFNPCCNVSSIKEVVINGKTVNIDLDLEKLDSIVLNNDTHKINGIYDYDGEIVKLLIGKDYHNIEVEELRPYNKEKCSVGKKKEEQIRAPMPGKIISINVSVGDCITKGQDLLILEAMKMENRIKAPNNGILKKINTTVGATCNSRDLLMTIE